MKRLYLTLLIITVVVVLGAQPLVVTLGDDVPMMRHRPRVSRMGTPTPRSVSSQRRSVGDINLAPRGLLILAEFTDAQFLPENTAAAFDSLVNSPAYTYNDATGSTREYYRVQSNGQYVPDFDVIGPVVLPHDMAFYGANDSHGYDKNTGDFMMDAVAAADLLGVDFTLYDNNHDGYIDFVYVIYAGYGEADSRIANTIWPHNWDMVSNFYYGYTTQTTYYYRSETDFRLPQYDGLYLNDYACSSCLRANGDRAGIGTFSHEFGHVLGLPDYYPVEGIRDYSLVRSYSPGAWSIMGYACYTNQGRTPCNYSVYDKYYLGWLTPSVMEHGQTYRLTTDYDDVYVVTRDGQMPASGSRTQDTVYYLENRQYIGWDAYLPGHGLLVWQVVYDPVAWYNNTPNNENLIGYTLLTASGRVPYTTYMYGADREDVPFPGNDTVTSLTLFDRYMLCDIAESDGLVSFRFVDKTKTMPTDNRLSYDEPSGVSKQLHDGRIEIRKQGRVYDLLGRPIGQ